MWPAASVVFSASTIPQHSLQMSTFDDEERPTIFTVRNLAIGAGAVVLTILVALTIKYQWYTPQSLSNTENVNSAVQEKERPTE